MGSFTRMQVDTYDERTMFSARFPLVAAFPTPDAIAAVMPTSHRFRDADVVRRELGASPGGHALRRTTHAEWSTANTIMVPVPAELIDAHAAEVADVVSHPRTPTTSPTTSPTAIPPFDEHRDAQLALMRRRIEVDPITWATGVAQADERGMIIVAEQTRDWAPWAPMLRFAVSLREIDKTNLVLRAAEHRLRLIARRLLDAQSFTDVRVDDTLGLLPQMQCAVAALLGR